MLLLRVGETKDDGSHNLHKTVTLTALQNSSNLNAFPRVLTRRPAALYIAEQLNNKRHAMMKRKLRSLYTTPAALLVRNRSPLEKGRITLGREG